MILVSFLNFTSQRPKPTKLFFYPNESGRKIRKDFESVCYYGQLITKIIHS